MSNKLAIIYKFNNVSNSLIVVSFPTSFKDFLIFVTNIYPYSDQKVPSILYKIADKSQMGSSPLKSIKYVEMIVPPCTYT